MHRGMIRPWAAPVVCALAASALGLAIAHGAHGRHRPATIAEVQQAAEQAGLFYGRARGVVTGLRLLVARTPVRTEQVLNAELIDLDRPFWIGRVLVLARGKTPFALALPRPTAQWGDMDLYGDPALVRELMQP